jgi:hypothetical protein
LEYGSSVVRVEYAEAILVGCDDVCSGDVEDDFGGADMPQADSNITKAMVNSSCSKVRYCSAAQ